MSIGLAGCNGADTPTTGSGTVDLGSEETEFCVAGAHLIGLLEPADGETPEQTRKTFDLVGGWLDQAERSAPDDIAEDVAAFAAAYRNYRSALRDVGYDIDIIFSTPEGEQFAINTSHSLTPAIIEHWTGVCGLSLGDQPRPPPTTVPPPDSIGSD